MSKEKIKHIERADSAASKSEKIDSQEADLGVDLSGVMESVDGVDDGGEAMGNVAESSEGLGEHRQASRGKASKFHKKMTDDEAKELKKKLLAKPPTKKQMVNEIRKHIHDEIAGLNKQARVLRRKGSYKELSLAVSRIRELHGILAKLFYATADALKGIWLKVVHGIV